MNITSKKLVKIYIISVLLNTAFFSLLYIFFPELSENIFAEDNLVENLSALFYLLSFFLGLYIMIRLKERKHRKFYIILPIVSLIFFTEEIDFAQRIIHFHSPLVYHIHLDSVHDIIPIIHEFLQVYTRSFVDSFTQKYLQINTRLLIDVSLVALFVVILVFLWKYRKSLYRLTDTFRKYPSIGLFLIGIGFLSSVQVFDLNLIKPSFVIKIEELFEMNGALTVLFASLSAVHTARIDEQSKTLQSEQLKHMPVLTAASLSFFVIMGFASYFILSSHTIKHEHESRKYVKQIIPLILTSWDAEAFIENVPSVLSVNSHDEIRRYFSARSQNFGPMKNYRFTGSQFQGSKNLNVNLGVKNKTVSLEKAVIFEHNLSAVFENARATIKVETVKQESVGWRIVSMKIEPIK